MLTSLHIENFALIDSLSIDFSDGFSIITGETGAGKSILLGALGLALGKRADSTSLRDPEKKCVIEAHFDVAAYGLESRFEDLGLDYDPQTIIRREILPGGKSRAFVNDSPANLQALTELSANLIDIHSQHETRSLSDSENQFRILDALAGNGTLLAEYTLKLSRYRDMRAELEDMRKRFTDSARESDYKAFLLTELTEARLDALDQAELESEGAMLENMSSIMEQLERARAFAEDEQFGFLSPLREFKVGLQKLAPFSSSYDEWAARASASMIELRDLVSELSANAASLSVDPGRLEIVNAQLQGLYNLQKKHHVATVAELIEIRDGLAAAADVDANLGENIARTEIEIATLESELKALAGQITASRRAASPTLSEKIGSILQNLGMPHALFQADLSPAQDFLFNGTDRIEFMFAANKGSGFAPMRKVASGGEMSRIMLAVKAVLAGYAKLPAIIFDEIDTGVSGEIADSMGNIMNAMAQSMQVFAITHLPQIAAKGSRHYKVFKTVSDGRTQTGIAELEGERRIAEIAQMLSGSQVSESAINHARALLS